MKHLYPLRFAFLSLCLGFLILAPANTHLEAQTTNVGAFKLTSPAFTDGGTLPEKYTCDGGRASPPLAWSNPPAGTKFFAITMHHIPGPGDKHVYLVIYNIPASILSLPENGRDIGIFGINTVNGKQEYTPPCSKGPGPKLYTMTAYALSSEAKLDVPASAVTMDLLLAAIKDKTLATAVMNVTYDRTWKVSGQAGDNQGQPPSDGPKPRIPRELETALASLSLSSDQKQKVDVLIQDYQEKQRALRDGLLQQLKGTLDAQQYAKISEAMQKPPGQPPGSRPVDTPPAPPNP